MKRILDAAEKLIGRLPKRDFAIPLAAVAQNDAEHVRLGAIPICSRIFPAFYAVKLQLNRRVQLLNSYPEASIAKWYDSLSI